MTPTRTAPSDEEMHEIVRRGQEWYDTQIRAKVEADNFGKCLMIDVTTGDYAMGKDPIETMDDIRARRPDSVLYGMRVGFPAFGKRGGGWKLERK